MTDPKTVTSPVLAVLVCTLGIFLLSAMDAAVKTAEPLMQGRW